MQPLAHATPLAQAMVQPLLGTMPPLWRVHMLDWPTVSRGTVLVPRALSMLLIKHAINGISNQNLTNLIT
jgi:hypothetical protein